MTTVIATREGILSDTLCSYVVPFAVTKIARIGNSVFGGAGDMDDLAIFFEWLRNGQPPDERPVFEEPLDILEVASDGIYLWGKKFVRLKIHQPVYCVGSGAHYAMGALAQGATPKQALKIASKLDSGTGTKHQFLAVNK